jgi:hypothetical protein
MGVHTEEEETPGVGIHKGEVDEDSTEDGHLKPGREFHTLILDFQFP